MIEAVLVSGVLFVIGFCCIVFSIYLYQDYELGMCSLFITLAILFIVFAIFILIPQDVSVKFLAGTIII